MCKRTEVNKEPTHFLAIMNKGKAFPRFDSMVCSYSTLTTSNSIRALTNQNVLDFLKPSKTQFIRK